MHASTRNTWLAVTALAAAIGMGTAVAQTSPVAPIVPQAAPQPGPGGMGMQGGRHGMQGGQHGRSGAERGARMMAQHDTDRDGQLSRAELESAQQAAAARRMQAFDLADADKDGKLAAEEMRVFRDLMHARLGTPGAAKGMHRHGEQGRRGPRGGPVDGAPAAPVTPLSGA